MPHIAVMKLTEKGGTAEQQERRVQLQRDLFYIKNFPRDKPYISLLPSEETPEVSQASFVTLLVHIAICFANEDGNSDSLPPSPDVM